MPPAQARHVAWKTLQKAERQLRDIIATAPANGLKPELFLKGRAETGPRALTDAALKYASALANGYADPTKLHEVYTIPHPMVDVRSGLQQAMQKGDVKAWFASLVPADRRISRAQPGPPSLPAAGGASPHSSPSPTDKPIKPGRHDPARACPARCVDPRSQRATANPRRSRAADATSTLRHPRSSRL